jgi:hypothetical protein
MRPTTTAAHLLFACLVVALLAVPATGAAAESTATAPPGETTTGAAPVPQPEGTGQTTPGPAATTTPQPTTTPAPATPQVQQQFSQGSSPGAPPPKHAAHVRKGSQPAAPGEGTETAARRGPKAVSPGTLTPNLPLGLGATLGGVPGFFIESFGIPPFLLPIFQAAGTAYGVPWQVLAAINQVETDYGRDLSVSSAGAEGWMQFLPASWSQYGVDANGDGYKDPYNPADAIFAAARYLRAAGGDTDIRGAVFAYNHSQAYVDSVMLRAQLLGGSPAELLGALTALTEARFPVHAAAHFSDGFPTVAASGSGRPTALVGTSIYAQDGAPVIAVQDGEVVQIGRSPTLGRFVVLRDAFGNTYTYARLGQVASLYPVLQPHLDTQVSPRIHAAPAPREPAPSGPATAGVQPRSPLSEGATVSGLAFGAAAGLEATPSPASPPIAPVAPPAPAPAPQPRVFRSGVNDVYLHGLHAGVQVIAGTVLGHVGAGEGGGAEGQPHIVFQIRPAGVDAPEIDPKPILDGWVALESSSIFRAKGENPFLATSPTVGQVLLESKQQLEPQVLRDAGIGLGRCGRQDVEGGRVDRRVLAMLEYMSVSGLRPAVAGLPCPPTTPAALAANAPAGAGAVSVRITAVNGVPVAGHQEPGSVVDTAVRKLLMLQGASRPQRIVSLLSYPGVKIAQTGRAGAEAILVDYPVPLARGAHAAGAVGSALSPSEWVQLIARLGEIPDPTVARAPSSAAIADAAGAAASEGLAHGHH